MFSCNNFAQASSQAAGEGDVVKAFEAGVESFVVSSEASEEGLLREALFDDPSSWHKHESAFEPV